MRVCNDRKRDERRIMRREAVGVTGWIALAAYVTVCAILYTMT
jgi:hypothetical protein